MLEKIVTSFNTYKVAREERKKLQLERESKIDAQRHQIELERLKAQTKLLSEGKILPEDLDRLSMEQMERSVKDEIIMAILFAPIVLVFFPWFQETISNGFDILDSKMPDWYMYMVSGIVIVTYGLRGMVKWAFSSKVKAPRIFSQDRRKTATKEE